MDLVKTADFDNYLSGLILPRNAQRAFFAIRAFNHEIAQVRDQSKNNFMTGRIRFQFWKDSLQRIYDGDNVGELQDQPVLKELERCIKEHDLTQRFFERCIEARISDFGGSGFENISDLEWYAESSHSSILYLVLETLGIRGSNHKTAHAASHVGCSAGIVTLLRGFPYHLSQGLVYLPDSIVRKHGVNIQAIASKRISSLSGDDMAPLSAAIFDIASQANGHLDEARSLIKKHRLEKNFMYALLPAVRSNMFLQTLQQQNFNPLSEVFLNSNGDQLKYQLNLLRAMFLTQI